MKRPDGFLQECMIFHHISGEHPCMRHPRDFNVMLMWLYKASWEEAPHNIVCVGGWDGCQRALRSSPNRPIRRPWTNSSPNRPTGLPVLKSSAGQAYNMNISRKDNQVAGNNMLTPQPDWAACNVALPLQANRVTG